MSTTQSVAQAARANGQPARQGILDVDVHPAPRDADMIRQHLDMPFRERYQGARRAFYRNPVHADRLDSMPPGGGPAGSDPDFMRKQLIDEYGVAYAILFPRTFCNTYPDPDQGSAIAAAFNQWLVDEWLDTNNDDGAFKGSITINHHDPLRAAQEIERWAGHPHMVQVATDSGARAPLGQRQYYPIYEACERHGLRLGIHPGSDGMGINDQPTPGYPTHYVEWHCGMTFAFQAHLLSFLTEGVFERFPGLKVAMVEGGVAWLAPLMWRLDSYWKALRSEVPWVKRLPSEYVADHVRLGTQPLERPADDKGFLNLLELMDARRVLMFSSDYPHWDFDSPTRAFPKLADDMREAIFSTNAREFYGLV
jgi:uncharacterized protein